MHTPTLSRRPLAIVAPTLLAVACGDAPVHPRAPNATPGAAPGAPRASAAAAALPRLAPKAYAFVPWSADDERTITNVNTFGASGGAVRVTRIRSGMHRVRFAGLAAHVAGTPHVQVTPLQDSQHGGIFTGYGLCGAAPPARTAAGDVEVLVTCEQQGGGVTEMPFSVQLFDAGADAPFATVRRDGTAEAEFQTVRTERLARGRYAVTFRWAEEQPFTPNAVVTPRPLTVHETGLFGDRLRSCQLFDVLASAREARIQVRCYNAAGALEDGAFHALLLSRADKGAHALVFEGPRVLAENSRNAGGGPIGVQRLEAGAYQVTFAGLGRLWTDGGTAKVVSHGVRGENCVLGAWGRDAATDGVRVNVRCRLQNGALADSRFAVFAAGR